MSFPQNDRPQRQLVDISNLNITCTECGGKIEKLPFQPTLKEDGTYGKLFCYQCNKNRFRDRGDRRNFGGR